MRKTLILKIIILFPTIFFGQYNNSIVIVEESIGIPEVVLLGDRKKVIVNKYGASDKFFYSKIRIRKTLLLRNRRTAKTVTVRRLGRPKYIYYNNNLQFYIIFGKDKKVRQIYFTSTKFQTSKGLFVGDSRDKVSKLYKVSNSPILLLPKQGIDIVFECDIVKEIRIYKAYMD